MLSLISRLLRKALRILFCPGVWKHIQNKELSYIRTFNPRYWILLVTLTVYGPGTPCLLSRSSRRTPSASLYPFEKFDNHHASSFFEASANPADQKITAHLHLRSGSAI